jgi:tetratricopeptide (TPR) repeat protein
MNQATETFLRIESIFNEVQDAPEKMRPGLIDFRSGGDPEVAAEIWSLLAACEAAEKVTASRQINEFTGLEASADARRIGPYLIDRLLGRGGMGAVYLAHRADGEFEQDVAIKLIDLPLATDLFRERFRQERQILAGLHHPFIARLLDGGVTPDGDPYLVMEYVAGVPIHRFCDERKLSLEHRIALFLRVCEAVQFAHQNLVVHRDLKPDNILVAEDATPRLLDFGTAKLLSPSLENQGSNFTREGYQSFTPQYASPEQILGYPITTASDTYSLGVLLYLLLTGALPYELKNASTAEMLRVVCERPPRRPSEALANAKNFDPDLEAILLKALRKEPQERYRTAEQLAADVRAWQDGRPVAARRGTLQYRTTKFVRRHWIGLAAAAALLITLLAGIAGVAWQARVANQQRRKAEARSADLRQLSNSLLSELDEAIKQLPGSTGVQKLLVTRVLEHLDRMAKDAQGDRLTQLDLIDAYTRLGNIQGNAYDQNLGDTVGALLSLDKALAIAAPLASSNANDTDATLALALVEQSRSEILWQIGKTPEAVAAMQQAAKSFDALITGPHATPTLIGDAAGAHSTLGDELGQPGTMSNSDLAGALAEYRKAIDLDHRALSIDPDFLRCRRGLAIMEMKIGTVEFETDPAQALKDFELSLAQTEALPASVQSSLATIRLRDMVLRKEADSLAELGKINEAAPLFAKVAKLQSDLAAADPQDSRSLFDLQVILNDEAMAYESAANPALGASDADRHRNLAAEQQPLVQAIAALEKLVKHNPTDKNARSELADAQVRLGILSSVLGKSADAEAVSKKGTATLRGMAVDTNASPIVLDQAASAFVTAQPASLRDPQFAVSCAQRATDLSRHKRPLLLLTLARAYRSAGQQEKSRITANEALALLPTLAPSAPQPNTRKLLENLANPTR